MHEISGQALRAEIDRRSRQLLSLAAPLCRRRGIAPPDPVIRFDLTGQAAGQARWQRGSRPVLRFNLEIATHHTADFLARTVAHEVAHLVVAACHPRARPHGAEWRTVMAHLGCIDASRCHDYCLDGITVKRQRRWPYTCACGRHDISTTLHNRIRDRGARYHCRRCGTLLTPCPD